MRAGAAGGAVQVIVGAVLLVLGPVLFVLGCFAYIRQEQAAG